MKRYTFLIQALFSAAMFILSAPVFGNEVAAAIGGGIFFASLTQKADAVAGMNNVGARMIYENAKQLLQNAFPGQSIAAFKMTQSYLRLELALAANQTNYNFQILNQTTGSQFNTEKRLNLQDSFVIAELAVLIAKPSSSTDSNFELDTYANTVKYTNAGAMNALYNGELQAKINNDVVLPGWDLQRHFYRPQTQQTAAANSPLDQKRLAEDAFYAVEPNIVCVGSKNTQFSIVLPQALSAVDANSRVILLMRGILAQNSTVVS